MPKRTIDLGWSDVAALWLDIQPELARRGFYPEFGLHLVVSTRKPSVAHDLTLEVTIRKRQNNIVVWRDMESMRIPGRMKLRPLSNVLAAMLQRAYYEVAEAYPIPDATPE